MTGAVFAVLGPSGAGKDTLIRAAQREMPDLWVVERVITRPVVAGGEVHRAVCETDFLAMEAAGEFALSWQAHGLHYGLPRAMEDAIGQGRTVVFNGSRAVMGQAMARFVGLRAIVVTAPGDVRAARIAARGREDTAAGKARMARRTQALPAGLPVVEIDNSGDLDAACAAFCSVLAAAQG